MRRKNHLALSTLLNRHAARVPSHHILCPSPEAGLFHVLIPGGAGLMIRVYVPRPYFWFHFLFSSVSPCPTRTADGVQHVRVQAGGEEPVRPRGRSQPAAEGDKLRGGAATHHERLQVCEKILKHLKLETSRMYQM